MSILDPRLDRPADGTWFEPSDTDSELEYSRSFAVREYLKHLCDVYEQTTKKTSTGARVNVVHLVTLEVPCHVTTIGAQYAGFESDGRMGGSTNAPPMDVEESIIYLPYGYPVKTNYRIKLHPTEAHGELWLSVESVSDTGSYGTMTQARVTEIGIPEEIEE